MFLKYFIIFLSTIISIVILSKENKDIKNLDYEETIVITGIKRKLDKKDTQYVISNVTKDKIDENLALSIGESIKNISGIYLFSKGVIMVNPIIRGIGGRRVLLLIDGDIIFSNKTMGVVGYFINHYNIERVEVIKGAASVLYGNGAIGGVINIVTKDPFDKKDQFYGRIGGNYGTNGDKISLNSAINYHNDNFFASLSGRLRDGNNYKMGGGEVVKGSYFHDKNIFFKTGVKFGNNQIIFDYRDYFGDNIGKAQDQNDIDKFAIIHFPKERNSRYLLTYQYKPQKNNTIKRVKSSIFFNRTRRVQHVDIYENNQFKDIFSYTEKVGNIDYLGGNGVIDLNLNNLDLILGYDFIKKNLSNTKESFMKDLTNFNRYNSLGKFKEFKNVMQFQIGGFSEFQLNYDSLKFILSLRGDLFYTDGDYPEGWDSNSDNWVSKSVTNSALSSNFGIVYNFTKNFTIKSNISRSFRAPDIRELFFAGANCYGYSCGDPDLKPELAHSFDLSLFYKKRGLKIEFNSYIYHIKDFITLSQIDQDDQTDNICELKYQNISKALLIGFEGDIEKRFRIYRSKLQIKPYISTSYTYGENLVDNQPMSLIPPFRADIGVRIFGKKISKYFKSYFFEIDTEYQMAQNRIAENEEKSDPFFILNGKMGVKFDFDIAFLKDIMLSFKFNNILDKKYKTHLSTPYKMGRDIKFNIQIFL